MIMFKLPFPPSVNTYWRKWNNRMVLSPKGRQYKADVLEVVGKDEKWDPFLENEELKLFLELYPPDRRRRDIDNYSKGLLDALGAAYVYGDDSQIKAKLSRLKPMAKPGYCIVSIGLITEDFGFTF